MHPILSCCACFLLWGELVARLRGLASQAPGLLPCDFYWCQVTRKARPCSAFYLNSPQGVWPRQAMAPGRRPGLGDQPEKAKEGRTRAPWPPTRAWPRRVIAWQEANRLPEEAAKRSKGQQGRRRSKGQQGRERSKGQQGSKGSKRSKVPNKATKGQKVPNKATKATKGQKVVKTKMSKGLQQGHQRATRP